MTVVRSSCLCFSECCWSAVWIRNNRRHICDEVYFTSDSAEAQISELMLQTWGCSKHDKHTIWNNGILITWIISVSSWTSITCWACPCYCRTACGVVVESEFSYRVTNINLYATSCTINRSFAATSQLFFFGCFFLFRVNVPIWKRWTGGTRRGRRAVLWDQRHKTTYSYKHTQTRAYKG